MSFFARSENGVVVEVVELPDNLTPSDAFHPDIAKMFRACTSNVLQGWADDGKKFSAPPVDLGALKSAKCSELKSECEKAIYAGVSSSALGSTHEYPMDDNSQKNYLGAVSIAGQSSTADAWSRSFWCADDVRNWSYTAHDKAQVLQLGLDIVAFTEAQQAKYASLLDKVKSAEDGDAVNAIAW